MDKCPQCGSELPAVLHAFCPSCRSSLNPERPAAPGPPAQALSEMTMPGQAVLVFCLLGAVAGTAWYAWWLWGELPSGTYPIWFFAVPPFAAAMIVAFLLVTLLRACGISTYKPHSKDVHGDLRVQREWIEEGRKVTFTTHDG